MAQLAARRAQLQVFELGNGLQGHERIDQEPEAERLRHLREIPQDGRVKGKRRGFVVVEVDPQGGDADLVPVKAHPLAHFVSVPLAYGNKGVYIGGTSRHRVPAQGAVGLVNVIQPGLFVLQGTDQGDVQGLLEFGRQS